MISVKEEKLRLLKESLEKGAVTKEEYDKGVEELQKGKEEVKSHKSDAAETSPEGSDKTLVFAIIALVVLFTALFLFLHFRKEQPKTIEEMHLANLKNKLNPEQGYLYKGLYSFINLEGFWFTQISSKSGKTLYDLSMRYSPRELEDIRVGGWLNGTLFNEKKEYYVAFNPTGNDFAHVALAVGDFNTHMVNAFLKMPVAACDRNETAPCSTRPIVTCENTKDEIVLYVKESDAFKVSYDNNCILIEGNDFDLVKGVDRVLYNFYEMMGQQG